MSEGESECNPERKLPYHSSNFPYTVLQPNGYRRVAIWGVTIIKVGTWMEIVGQ